MLSEDAEVRVAGMDQQSSILDEHDDTSTTKYVLEHGLARGPRRLRCG